MVGAGEHGQHGAVVVGQDAFKFAFSIIDLNFPFSLHTSKIAILLSTKGSKVIAVPRNVKKTKPEKTFRERILEGRISNLLSMKKHTIPPPLGM